MRKLLKISKMLGAVVGFVGGGILTGPLTGAVMAIPHMPAGAEMHVAGLIGLGITALATWAAPANQ